MQSVEQWSEDAWRRACLVVSAKVVEALVHKGRAETFGVFSKHDPRSAEILDRVEALSNQAARLAENLESEKRTALFEVTYDCASEDKRNLLFKLEDGYEIKCKVAKAIASEEMASRRQSGETFKWSTVELAQEWQRIYERLLAADKKTYETQVSSLGLSRRASGSDAPTFWDELKRRCRETLKGPDKPKEHPHVERITQIVNEMASLADQIKEFHDTRRQTESASTF